MKTMSHIIEWSLPTEAERTWAAGMGTDYRRAWNTAPFVTPLVALAAHLAPHAGFLRFASRLLSVLGGDESSVDWLHDALHSSEAAVLHRAVALLRGLPGLPESPEDEREVADAVRARVSYDDLIRGWS